MDSGAKVLVVHADLLDEAGSVVPDGVVVLVAPTPPVLAEAFGIDQGRCRVPDGDTHWGR